MKRCYKTKRLLPLFMFHKIHPDDYQLKTDQGVTTVCRVCTYKRVCKEGEMLSPYMKRTKSIGDVRRFTSIDMTKWEAFKYFFLMSYTTRRKYIAKRLNEQGLEPYN